DVAPPTATTVTMTLASDSTALISKDTTTAGTNQVTFENITNRANMVFHIQGLAEGSTTLTVSAPGYADETMTVTIHPSGFQLTTADFTTSTFSTNTHIHIDAYRLNTNGTWSA